MNENDKEIEFTVITDSHYYSKKLGYDTKSYKKQNGKSQKLLKDSEEVISAAFAQIAKKTSDIVLFCGDATCDGEYESHEEFIKLLEALQLCGKKVYAITSTHDFRDNEITYKYTGDVKEEIPSAKRSELYEMYHDFGPDKAVSEFPEGLSYVADLDDTFTLFALNSDKDGTGRSGFTAECKKWIEKNVDRCKAQGRTMIAMTHHPLISPSPFYYIIGKSNMMGGYDEIREWLADMGINLVFSGHTHVHDISYVFSEKGNVFYDVATSALAGYPAYMRNVKLDTKKAVITSEKITEPVKISFNGKNLDEHLSNQFFGMIRNTITAAGNDTPTFADCADAMSIKAKPIYRFGWLIKPFAKLLNKLTIGRVAKWTKKESGLREKDYADIKDNKVVDFIIELVMYLYEGDAPYTPDTPQYKITVGFLNIIDSFFKAIHLPFSKILKGFDSVSDLVIPLLYNKGICDKDAVLALDATQKDVDAISNNNFEDTVKKSKKGPFILAILILLIIILIPLIPVIAVILGIGFLINEIRYSKEIRGK